jgi:aminotransferase
MSSSELAEELLENVGVAVLPGDIFGDAGKDHLRISFATSEEQINEGLTRLQEQF